MKKPDSYYSTDQNIRFEMLTAEQETALWVKARSGDDTAREFLITNHLLFAHMEAQRISRGLLPKDEVTSAANFAVMKAFESFDHKRGFKFNTYLRPFIKGEIAALWKSKFSNGVPDPSLLGAGADGLSRHSYGEANKFFESDPQDSFHRATSEVDGSRGHIELSEEHAGERLDFEQYSREAVASVLAKLTKKEAALIQLVYVERQSFADVARARGCSRQAVEQTHSRVLKKLKKLLKAAGVVSAQ